MMLIVITLFIGFIGGLVGKKFRFPAPFMLGSMFSVAIFSIMYGDIELSTSFKTLAQIISGAYIGQNISKNDLKMLPKLSPLIISLMVIFTLNMLVVGVILMVIFKFDAATALLSCLPGGVMDVSLMSIDMGAKPDVVATLQTARFVGIMLILPIWVSYWTKRFSHDRNSFSEHSSQSKSVKTDEPVSKLSFWQNDSLILTVSTLGGLIGIWLQLPVGALIGSVLVSSALKITRSTRQLPRYYRSTAQVFAGSLIGTSFTYASLLQMGSLIIPIILLLGSYLVINVCFGKWISKGGLLDVQSALFASSPAGATDISLLAGELGGDMPKIATIQICRILYTVVIMPLIVKVILTFMM
ncbi:AbrB family transcriptional regulator [Streptococcus pluranimalium]|uniref:AbrB family transcriptional regulator n=1 Tax=Streptococcus pluranimalium TaxID=82348 RepID=UPI0024151296|nr:AbrB family transcriptional regulator [Streptococcus pluranimalium]WFM80842.1 AbrB family transcriptional regulator [Streptococcus pluranimalium]